MVSKQLSIIGTLIMKIPNYIASQVLVYDSSSVSIWSIRCRNSAKQMELDIEEPFRKFSPPFVLIFLSCLSLSCFMAITFRIVIECRENHVVHVDPNWTSPVRWVMFSVALHVQ